MLRSCQAVAWVILPVVFGCAWDNPLRARRDEQLRSENPALAVEVPLFPSATRAAGGPANGRDTLPQIFSDPLQNRDGTLSLRDAFSLALKHSEVVRVLDGGDVMASGVTAYDPEVRQADVQAALAAFDTNFIASLLQSRYKQPPNAFFGPGLAEPSLRDEVTFNAGFAKPLLSGGEARVLFNPSPGYLYLPQGNGDAFNPTYVGELEFSLRQPLLRGAGPEVTTAPLKIVQIKAEQSGWDLKYALMDSVRSIAEAYWQLYAARVALQSLDDVIPLLEEVVQLQEKAYRTQWVIYADVAKAHAQLHDYRQQRFALLSQMQATELRLRNLLGVPPADGWNLVPTTWPTKTSPALDAQGALELALANHPDLARQRLNVRIREVEWGLAENGLQPQLDFQSLYRMNGLGQDLGDALEQLASAEYGDWGLGLSFSVPLGRRQATATARAAELQLQRERALLQQVMHATAHRLGDVLRQVRFSHLQYLEAEQRQQAAEEWLKGSRLRYQNPLPAGEGQNWLLQSLNDYLAAVRFRTDAASEAASLLAQYNVQLVRFEEAKGTILTFFDIDLTSDPCKQVPRLNTSSLPGPQPPEPGAGLRPETDPAPERRPPQPPAPPDTPGPTVPEPSPSPPAYETSFPNNVSDVRPLPTPEFILPLPDVPGTRMRRFPNTSQGAAQK